jgi:hypothetical protein
MCHIIGDAGGVGRLSDQPADRREPETKQLEKGSPPLDVCLGLGDDDPTILSRN